MIIKEILKQKSKEEKEQIWRDLNGGYIDPRSVLARDDCPVHLLDEELLKFSIGLTIEEFLKQTFERG